MNTHCDYKLSDIIEQGNGVYVDARFFEGLYEDVTIDGVTTEEYVRKVAITEPVQLYFEKFPVSIEEIKTELKEMLILESNLEIIPECQ